MNHKLTPVGINAAVGEIESYLSKKKNSAKDILRIRLGVEEVLLRFQEQFGEDKEFFIKCGKSLGRTKISVVVQGTMFDPFSKLGDAESSSAFMRTALATMGNLPVWKYLNGANEVYFTLSRKSMPEWSHLAFAVISAAVLGVLLQFVPVEARNIICDDVLTPLINTFLKLIGGIAGPMVFLAIVWGIYSIGDAVTFSALGKRLAGRYLLYTTVLTLMILAGTLPFLTLTIGNTQGEGDILSIIIDMILQIVPGNIVEPFSSGNTLQILFLGIVVGVAMIFISEKTQTVAPFVEQLNYIVQTIMDCISKLVPLFVFGSLINIILNVGLSGLKSAYKLFLFNVIGAVFLMLFATLFLMVRMRLSPALFWKKTFSVFLIVLTTASSSAAFASNISTCKEEFGIQDNLTNFGVPFGQIIYKPSASLLYLTTALYMAEVYQVPTSAAWIVTAVFMSILLSIATPPVPGGSLASFSVLFAQLGIPVEGIAVVITLDAIMEFILTPANIIQGQAMLIVAAKNFKLLNEDVLYDRVKKAQ